MEPFFYIDIFEENESYLVNFEEIIDKIIDQKDYQLDFTHTLSLPISPFDLESIISTFVIFFPIYDTSLQLAKGEPIRFEKLLIGADKQLKEYYDSPDHEVKTKRSSLSKNLSKNY
jgi:hypothetical protein